MFQDHTWNCDVIPKDMQDISIEKTDGRIVKIQSCGFQSFLFFRKQKNPDILTGKFFWDSYSDISESKKHSFYSN